MDLSEPKACLPMQGEMRAMALQEVKLLLDGLSLTDLPF